MDGYAPTISGTMIILETVHITEAPLSGSSLRCVFFFSLGDKEDDGASDGT